MSDIYADKASGDTIERFGELESPVKAAYQEVEGTAYLRSKSDKFRQYTIRILGTEIYFYKKGEAVAHKFMHCLAGTFIEDKPEVNEDGAKFYPLKIVLGRTKARIVFFDDLRVK